MPWYVVRTVTRMEAKIIEEIGEIAKDLPEGHLSAYSPMETRMKDKRAGRVVKREAVKLPIMPGYIFARFQTDGCYHLVKAVNGVLGFLGERPDKLPWSLPDGEVSRFRIAEASGLYDFTPHRKTYAKNDPLRVCRGPFIGYKAKYLSERPGDRIEVLMQALKRGGGEYPAELHRDDVEAVAA